MFFKHNFCVKPYVSRNPEGTRVASNRRLNVHVIYIPHCQESSSQPVPSQMGDDATRRLGHSDGHVDYMSVIHIPSYILHDVVPHSPKILSKPNFARSFWSKLESV